MSLRSITAIYGLIVQNRRKRVVIMMEQFLPLLVSSRLSESLLMRRDIRPSDEKKVMTVSLQAALKFV